MFIVAVNMALSGWPLFVVEVFPGHWQLNACSRPKRVNSRPCERNQTKLESTCYLSFVWCAIGFSWARQEKRECFGSGSVAIAGQQSTGWFRAGWCISNQKRGNAVPKPREDDGSATQVVRKG